MNTVATEILLRNDCRIPNKLLIVSKRMFKSNEEMEDFEITHTQLIEIKVVECTSEVLDRQNYDCTVYDLLPYYLNFTEVLFIKCGYATKQDDNIICFNKK